MTSIKYRDLRQYLLSLGFADESVARSHHAFRHAGSGTLIIWAITHLDDDPVRPEDLASARRHLVENGLATDRDSSHLLGAVVPPAGQEDSSAVQA